MSGRAKKYAIEVALTVGAIAGLLCVLIAIVSVSFGLSPLIFRSDSMSPAIDVGDVAISRSVPAADVAPGDIVSVSRPDGTRITHRVVTIDARVGNSTTMTLRGDANNVDDPEPYTVTTVDEILFHIPNLGYVLSWFANPYSWAVAALLTLGLLGVAFRPDELIHKNGPRRHAASPSARSRTTAIVAQALIVATVVAAAVAGFARTHGTLAPLTDSATATGSVSALRPDAPTAPLTCATVSAGILETNARLSWPNPTIHQAYTYEIVFTSVLSGASKAAVVPATTANPATLLVTRTYFDSVLGLALLGAYNVELRSKVGNFLSTGKLNISVNLLLGSVSCGSTTGTASAARAAPLQTAATSSQASAISTTSAPPSAMPTSSSATPRPSASETPTTSSPTPAPTISSEPPPTSTPPIAVADETSPGGTYIASASDGTVVIADKAGVEQFRADVGAVALTWMDDVTLRVTGDDGTVTTVTRAEGTWSASP